ncbi:hypothetical protein GWK47_022657 [Chionoecetes opilio]|uniref:Uncharacterized protein n=1 Tax=Chionoecetes opilio TaxID=41210 RepID=A0A8J4XMV3_CHIOP|nr:hypothetical protein GWK47_022657 [Chionoecetes opilio]
MAGVCEIPAFPIDQAELPTGRVSADDHESSMLSNGMKHAKDKGGVRSERCLASRHSARLPRDPRSPKTRTTTTQLGYMLEHEYTSMAQEFLLSQERFVHWSYQGYGESFQIHLCVAAPRDSQGYVQALREVAERSLAHAWLSLLGREVVWAAPPSLSTHVSLNHNHQATANHTSSSKDGGLQPALGTPATTPSSNSCREARVGSGAGGEAGVGTGGAAPSATPVVNTYRLSLGLRAAFASIGATDSAYSFREVLLLLKKYLFSNARLFDKIDKLYVNCESDPLGRAFGVTRFHFNDVRTLIVQNITKEQHARGPTGHEPPPVPDSSSPSVSVDGSNDSTCRVPAPPGAAPRIPVNGIVASPRTLNGPEGVATGSPEPGSSSNRGRQRLLPGQSSPPPLFTCPKIPDSCSDTETVYSVQGYVTVKQNRRHSENRSGLAGVRWVMTPCNRSKFKKSSHHGNEALRQDYVVVGEHVVGAMRAVSG